MFGEKEKIAYELDAFLAAARGCIDFIAGMLSLHLKGMSRRTSITSLLERAERHPTASFSRLLTRWKDWIELVKEYRDECIHYRAIRFGSLNRDRPTSLLCRYQASLRRHHRRS